MREVRSVARDIEVTLRTRSLTSARLRMLARRTPPKTPGTFAFPFGPVRYVDAASLEGLYTEIFLNGGYNIDATVLGSSPRILDCGANIGLCSIRLAQRHRGARITSYEADPVIARILEENMRALGLCNVEAVAAAVGVTTGQVTFLPDGRDAGRIGSGDDAVSIRCVRLSDCIDATVDLLKLDIEGGEFEVIDDLCATGAIVYVRHLICEVHGRRESASDLGNLWSMLHRAGFQVTLGAAYAHPALPGAPEPAPFVAAPSGKYLAHLYAWRDDTDTRPL